MITESQKKCICSNWEEIAPFRSMLEYNKFEKWIDELALEKKVNIVTNSKSRKGNKVYKCNECSKMWSLNKPDAPFGGSFGPLEQQI